MTNQNHKITRNVLVQSTKQVDKDVLVQSTKQVDKDTQFYATRNDRGYYELRQHYREVTNFIESRKAQGQDSLLGI